jgi:predicted nucleotidyltransferase
VELPPNRHFAEMLRALSDAGADFLIIGGYAVAAHGFVRATLDIDIWVRPTRENAVRVMRALIEFGAPLHGMTEQDLTTPGMIYQIGVKPSRIDILTAASGVGFDEAWAARISTTIDGREYPVIGLSELIANKRASGRPQDLTDIDRLEKQNQ